MKKKILLVGPEFNNNAKYGGGVGGYTRNMSTYLETLSSESFECIACYHTVRTPGSYFYLKFMIRMVVDLLRFLKGLSGKISIVHILGQYRGAIFREFIFALVCRALKVPYVYELKAGAFIDWYKSTNFFNKIITVYVLKKADLVLCEGVPYVDFLKNEFDLPSTYWPNFVPSDEVLLGEKAIRVVGDKSPLKVCFIGYCYQGKGVFELVEGVNLVANKGKPIELNIIGHETEDFKKICMLLDKSKNLKIKRFGQKTHDEVLDILKECDLFYLPSKHKGEGHNNSINEAMMLGVPIICSKQGFSYHLLKDGMAEFIDSVTPENIEKSINKFLEKDCGLGMSKKANEYFIFNLHSDVVIPKLITMYKNILSIKEGV